MTRAFVGVGSNIDPAENIRKAIQLLAVRTTVRAISTVYETAAEGRPEQPSFYNLVVEIETDLPPVGVKYLLLRPIEADLGRQRTADKYAARTIDLDLILYDELATTDGVTLPDPDITRRPFLAVPLYELAPALVLPGSGERIEEVARAMPRQHMKPQNDYTEGIRKEILHERKP